MYDQMNPYGQPFVPTWQRPMQPMQTAQPTQLIRVTGVEGARAFQMAANSTVPLFDANEDILYVKTTDGAGFPTIRAFRFTALEEQKAPTPAEYVTRDEFQKQIEELKGAIHNGKQSLRRPTVPDAE